jgi:hypothetical protein
MIDDGVEHAAGRRTPPEVFRSLCDHSGLTMRQLADVAEAEGLPVAIRFAVWRADRRKRTHGRIPAPPARTLRKHAMIVGSSGGVRPTRRRFGHVAADTREGLVGECAPLSARRLAPLEHPLVASANRCRRSDEGRLFLGVLAGSN